MTKIKDKWFYPSILILLVYLVIRLVNQSKLIYMFPLDAINDISSHMAQLFFLIQCGFHNLCPYWYNGGYSLFTGYPVGWFFFTAPIYFITKNIQIATYQSMLIMIFLAFIFIIYLGQLHRLSIVKRLAFFVFFFANPIVIGNFIRLGRLPEYFGWLIFIPFAFLILYYKNHKIDYKFILFIPIYSILMFSHPLIIILSPIVIASLFLVKLYYQKYKEVLIIVSCYIISLIISSFWWVPFLSAALTKNSSLTVVFSRRLFHFSGKWLMTTIASAIIPILLLLVFYFYWKARKGSTKEFIFFLPILIVNILFFFRLTPFIPILKHVYPDSWITFFLFFTIFYFLKTDFRVYPNYLKKLIKLALILLPIACIMFSHLYTPYFQEHTALEKETLCIFNQVEGKFLIHNPIQKYAVTSYPNAYYSYMPILHNLTTTHGWSYSEKDKPYVNILKKDIPSYFETKNCKKLIETMEYLNATEIITYDLDCDLLESCNLKEKAKGEKVCLYSI